MTAAKSARALADLDEGLILATTTIAAPPERVFRAISSEEVARWWGSDQVYRVTRWTADFRVGGAWRSEGKGADGTAFSVQGEFLEIDPPNKLVQTWSYDWGDKHVTKLTYRLLAVPEGTKLTIRHEGFKDPGDCASHEQGWETVLGWLSTYLTARGA